jgi:hypothetical protein
MVPYQTCHRRFQLWQRSGRLEVLLPRLAEGLRDRGKIDLSEGFVDATFAGAKKGALLLALRDAVKKGRTDAGGAQSPRMADACVGRDVAGRSNGYLLGCTTFVASLRAGNVTSRTSSVCSISPAPEFFSGIYEMCS